MISFIEAKLKGEQRSLGGVGRVNKRQKVQIVQRDCTTLEYTMTSDSSKETPMIMPLKRDDAPKLDADQLQESPDHDILFQQFSVKLTIKDCPMGFMLNETPTTSVLVNHHCQSIT